MRADLPTTRLATAPRTLTVVALTLVLAACGAGVGPGDSGPGPGADHGAATDTAGAEAGGDITVFAAASLTETFTALAAQFEDTHPGTRVVVSFGGSSTLAQQILSGAPADVFASASPATMELVTDQQLAQGEPTVFAGNVLQIAVPSGNRAGVTALEDLTDDDLTIALCAEQVPCGAAAVRVFEAAGLTPAPDTYEEDVRAALTKVRLDEVDAALVYRTDVLAAGEEVQGVDVPEAREAVNDYPIVLLAGAPNPEGGAAFVQFVLSETGRSVLEEAGFELP